MVTARITVVGGFMMELAFLAPRRPTTKETVTGTDFQTIPGGKAFRQAIAAGRAGGKIVAVGRIGQDDFGDDFLRQLVGENIETRWILRDPAQGTGIYSPLYTPQGIDGRIIVPRANAALSPEDISAATQVIANASVVLLPADIAIETTHTAATLARSGGAKIILGANDELTNEILLLADILIVDADAAERLTGETAPEIAAEALHQRGAKRVIITLGQYGCMLVGRDGTHTFAGYEANAVDITGADDAFSGALAVGVAERQPIDGSIRFALAAAALTAQVPGVLPALPTRYAIDRLMRK
jgi:ribokinase